MNKVLIFMFLFAVCITSAYAITSDGLIAYFGMDNQYQLVDDWSGYYNGTYGSFGVYQSSFSKFGYSANFTHPNWADEGNYTLDLLTSASQFNWNNTPYSLNVWIYPINAENESGFAGQMGFFASTTGGERNIIGFNYNNNQRITLFLGRASGSDWNICETNDTIPFYEWTMITFVFTNSTQVDTYANTYYSGNSSIVSTHWDCNYASGTMIENQLYTYPYSPYGNGNFSFGSGDYSSGYNGNYYGLVDEVSVWNKSLSIEDIQDLYNNGTGISLNNITETPCTNFSANALTLFSPIINATYYQNWIYFDILVNATGQNCYPDYDLEIGVLGNSCNYVDCGIVNDVGFTNMNETRYTKNITDLNESGTYTVSAYLYFPTSTQEYFREIYDTFYINNCTNFTSDMIQFITPSENATLYDYIYGQIFVNTTRQNCYPSFDVWYGVLGYQDFVAYNITTMGEYYYSFNVSNLSTGVYNLYAEIFFPYPDETYYSGDYANNINYTQTPTPTPEIPTVEQEVSKVNNAMVNMIVIFIIIGVILALSTGFLYTTGFVQSDWLIKIVGIAMIGIAIIILVLSMNMLGII